MSDYAAPPAIDHDPGRWETIILTVEVTEGYIKLGAPSDCQDCPIALAILGALVKAGIPIADGGPVKVYGDHASVTLADGRWYVGSMPNSARQFMRRFDHGAAGSYGPFTFHLGLERPVPVGEF